jgi:HAD superfamily hydrolase (TIGR01450 family)
MTPDVLKDVKALLLDLDGTLYLGDHLFDWTPAFLQTLRDLGVRAIYMTNNSSRSTADYVAKLNRLGIPAAADDIITSGQSALLYFRQRPELRRIYVFGTESLADEIRGAGLDVVTTGADAVLIGFPTTMTYETLCGAAFELQRGAVFLATHPDPACPSPRGLLPDAGSFLRCLTEATGREVDEVFGKPSEWMLHLALERAGVERRQMAVVGDRLMTDIAMGARHGMPSVLVLSGATSRADLAAADVQPDLVFQNVGALGEALVQVQHRQR